MTSCHHFRDHLSADLDGEAGPSDPEDNAAVLAAASGHLESCTSCSRWFADVTRINRLVRTAPAEPGPGLSTAQLDDLLQHLPQPSSSSRRPRWRNLARVALAVAGIAQVALGAWSLSVPHAAMDGHAGMLGAGLIHMSHEYSAWSIALGISFLVGSRWTRHLAGALPVLASFVAVLIVVSAFDLIDGNVDPARVVSHTLIVLALGLIVVIVVTETPGPRLRPAQRVGTIWTRRSGDHTSGNKLPSGIRILGADRITGGPEPAAQHRAA
ncbi:MAG: hypothetical protein M3Z25_02805 [Actinomycetota bacterium]|nr:hypothetical protein [Actinomycetota bacterium]